MKHGTLVVAALVSIFIWGEPLPTQAGGRGMSFSRPSGGNMRRPSNPGGGGSNGIRGNGNGRGNGGNWNGNGWNGGGWNGGGWNGGGWNGGYNYNNYQTYPDPNSYPSQPYQYPTDNGATTPQYAAPVTQDYATPAVQPNSVPTVQSNPLPSVGNTIATYKPPAVGKLQFAPMATSKPNSSSGASLTGPGNGGASSNGGTKNGTSGTQNGTSSTQNGTNGGNSGVGNGTASNNAGIGSGPGGTGVWPKGPKGPNGGKGKFAFAIVGGQLRQIFSSDDGGSWVSADPGSADNAVADDSQTPPAVDLAGQNPTAAITLLNPLETRSTVNFNLGMQNGSLQSGFAAQATAADPQLIVFDRGGSFGQAQYTLSPGTAYRFTATDQGWDLRTVTQ